jgi:hypothetical protein
MDADGLSKPFFDSIPLFDEGEVQVEKPPLLQLDFG